MICLRLKFNLPMIQLNFVSGSYVANVRILAENGVASVTVSGLGCTVSKGGQSQAYRPFQLPCQQQPRLLNLNYSKPAGGESEKGGQAGNCWDWRSSHTDTQPAAHTGPDTSVSYPRFPIYLFQSMMNPYQLTSTSLCSVGNTEEELDPAVKESMILLRTKLAYKHHTSSYGGTEYQHNGNLGE